MFKYKLVCEEAKRLPSTCHDVDELLCMAFCAKHCKVVGSLGYKAGLRDFIKARVVVIMM